MPCVVCASGVGAMRAIPLQRVSGKNNIGFFALELSRYESTGTSWSRTTIPIPAAKSESDKADLFVSGAGLPCPASTTFCL